MGISIRKTAAAYPIQHRQRELSGVVCGDESHLLFASRSLTYPSHMDCGVGICAGSGVVVGANCIKYMYFIGMLTEQCAHRLIYAELARELHNT